MAVAAVNRDLGSWPVSAAAAVLACAALVGCASHSHVPFTPTPEPAAAARPADTPYHGAGEPPRPVERVLDTSRRYELVRLSFPSIGDNGQPDNRVTVDYHRSRLPGRHPVVIVMPIWGRHVYPSNAITRTVRKRSDGSMHVLNVLGTEFLFDWQALAVEADEAAYLATWAEGAGREATNVADVRRLMDWVETRPEIDSGSIGLVGFSHSAIVAPALAAQDSRVAALVAVMGGAEPQIVLARCAGGRVRDAHDHAAEVFGWSADEMEDRLAPMFFPVNATTYAGRVDPARVLIIDSGKDDCIPERSRDALWQAMGRPERYTIDSTHKRSFLAMTPLNLNWLQKRMWDFLERRLLVASDD